MSSILSDFPSYGENGIVFFYRTCRGTFENIFVHLSCMCDMVRKYGRAYLIRLFSLKYVVSVSILLGKIMVVKN